MKQHHDGSVTLSKNEWEELSTAYTNLYEFADSQPTYLGDFFDDRREYIALCKWSVLVTGKPFDPSEFEEEEEPMDNDQA